LHELDGCPIRIANVDDAPPGIRASLESLRTAGRFPAGRCNCAQDNVKVINRKRDMNRPNVARSREHMLSIGRSMVFEQFNPVPGSLENSDRNFSAGHSGDFTGEITCVMRAVRKLETENITPESQRSFDVRYRDACVIGGNDAKRRSAHDRQQTSNATHPASSSRENPPHGLSLRDGLQRPTSNAQFRERTRPRVHRLAPSPSGIPYARRFAARAPQTTREARALPGLRSAKSVDDYSCNVAITLSSMAIGVGSAPTSTVVRVGFGFPSPAKYSG